MIVRFSTRNGQLTMLGEPAVRLIRLMGHTGTVPGAILAADLPEALRNLRRGLETMQSEPSPAGVPDEDDQESEETSRTPPVTLGMRAMPLLDMLETAVAGGQSDLMWERG